MWVPLLRVAEFGHTELFPGQDAALTSPLSSNLKSEEQREAQGETPSYPQDASVPFLKMMLASPSGWQPVRADWKEGKKSPGRGSSRGTGLSRSAWVQRASGKAVGCGCTGVSRPTETTASASSILSLLGAQGWEGLRPSPLPGERAKMETV